MLRRATKGALEPQTCVGRWLRALVLYYDPEERRRLLKQLNHGSPTGYLLDEFMVVTAACELAVRGHIPADADVQAISRWVAEMRSQIVSTTPPGQLELEALVRAALGEADVDVSDIRPVARFRMEGTILSFACRKLGVDEAAANALIVESERIAVLRGWDPPLAT